MDSTKSVYHSTAKIGSQTQSAIVASVVFAVIATIINALIQAYFPGEGFSEKSAILHVASNIAKIMTLILTVIALADFAIWASRGLNNLPALNACGSKYKGWYSWSIFVPILKLFLPILILQDIWKGSDPENSDKDNWKSAPTSKLIYVAWISWIAANVFPALSKSVPYTSIIGVGVYILACVLSIQLISKISTRQEAKFNLLRNSK